MRKNECPYCKVPLEEQDAYYLFTWIVSEDKKEQCKKLKKILANWETISNMRKAERFKRVWKLYNYQSEQELSFSADDFILSGEEVQHLIEALEDKARLKKTVLDKVSEKEPEEFVFRKTKQEHLVIEEKREVLETEFSESYFYYKNSNENEWDRQGKIAVGNQLAQVALVRRVCSHCYNLIPDDLYHYPIVNVYLMAIPGSGKTCMLYSLFLNQDKFNEKNAGKMEWKAIQEGNVDPYFAAFEKEKERYKETKEVVATGKKFVPPLFIKFTYKDDAEKNQSVILALYDNAGEFFRTDQNTMDQETADWFNRKIIGMDALLCIVNTENTELEKDIYGMKLSKDDLAVIRKKSKLLSKVEQERIENNVLLEELTLEHILNQYLSKKETQNQESDSDERKKQNMAKSNREIIKNLQNCLGGQPEMEKILKEKYFALVVSRTDRLIYSKLIEPWEQQLFFDKNIDYFSEEQKQKKLQRNKKIKKWQKEGILLQYDLRNFREVNYHFVAAHIEDNSGIQPIRIEEPFVGIVEDFIRSERK